MVSMHSNVSTFNEFVWPQMVALEAKGEHSSNKIVNIVKLCLTSPDNKFSQYIKQKKIDYEERQDLTKDDIITMAEKSTDHL